MSRWIALNLLSCLLLFNPNVDAYKFLAYIPMMARSHVTFVAKVTDALVDAGHEVTVIGPVIESALGGYGTDKAKIIEIPQTERARVFENGEMMKFMSNMWITVNPLQLFSQMHAFVDVMAEECIDNLNNKTLMNQLREEKFDVAYTEATDFCSMAIFHELGIEKLAITLSISSFDSGSSITGAPNMYSYVPGMMGTSGERMTFLQRVGNFITSEIGNHMFRSFMAPMADKIREKHNPHLPDIQDLLSEFSLVFLNSNPLINFPRPTTHKVIDIGGISLDTKHKPMDEEWSKILSLRNKTVLLSFGSVAKSFLMPEQYKKTIRETLRKFPDVTFIWKYEKPEHKISEGIPNIVETTWAPQRDMLYDPRLTLFITHGGQGSTTEATTAGVPLVCIPVGGDQWRNAEIIKRLGTGIVVDKFELETTKALEEALRELLSNPEYAEKAKRTGEMLRDRPFTPKELLVKNMEFLAKYGPLRQLDHYGNKLNILQYYLVDAFAFLAVIVIVFLFVVYKIVRCACSRIFSSKLKKD